MIQIHTTVPSDATYVIPREVIVEPFMDLIATVALDRSNPVMRAAIKTMLAWMLSMASEQITKMHLAMELPNQKCAEAKADFISYGLRYLLNFMVTYAEGVPWQVDGHIEVDAHESCVVVSKLSAALALAPGGSVESTVSA